MITGGILKDITFQNTKENDNPIEMIIQCVDISNSKVLSEQGGIMLVKPAHSLKKYVPLFDRSKNKVALDFGSGNLRNSMYLHRKGYEVYAVDLPQKNKIQCMPRLKCILPEEIKGLNSKIDVTICTFVLNIISESERNGFLGTLAEKMSPGGFFLVETKGFSLSILDSMIIPKGFVRVHCERGRYTIIVLYQYIGMQH